MQNNSTDSRFFLIFNWIILIIAVVGFSLNGITRPDTLPVISNVVIIHGLIMYLWYILVVVQSSLIKNKNRLLHQALGSKSFILSLGIVISGIWMTKVHFSRPNGEVFATINFFILINFVTLYTLGYVNRFRPDYHKRYMVYASLAALFPAIGRLVLGLSINQYASIPLWIILIFVIDVYDYRTSSKIHPATKVGTAMIFIGIVLTVMLMENKSWISILEKILQ